MENFIMLPNNLVWDNKTMNSTLLNIYGDKIVHIFMYLACSTNRFNRTLFTIKDLITSCDLIPKSGKNKINDQFKNILIDLNKNNIIETNIDFNKIKINDCINCKFNIPILKDNLGNNTLFFKINVEDYLLILDSNKTKIDKLILLKVYAYINSRVNRSKDKPECFYDSYDVICNDLKIHENTFKNCIKELNDMGLIYYDNIGLIERNNKTHTANNVYCLNENELSKALDQSEIYYKKKGYKIIDARCSKNIKKINGLKGKIKQQQNAGKDTDELQDKLEQLENITYKNNSQSLNDNKVNKIEFDRPVIDFNYETGEFTILSNETTKVPQMNDPEYLLNDLPF